MKKVVCHGDSLTEGSDLDRQAVWPALMGSALGLSVVNRGIGGDTSGGLLSRFYRDVVDERPDFVVILCGTNDIWWDLDVRQILANIFAMVFQAQHHGITPVIAAPLPVAVEKAKAAAITSPMAGFEKCCGDIRSLRDELLSYGKGSDIPVIDFFTLFLDGAERVRADLYLEDGLHPGRPGHRRMAAEAADRFRADFLFTTP